MPEERVEKAGAGERRGRHLYERLLQPCVAELMGSGFFVFLGCVSVIENVDQADRLQPALVHGLTVTILICCMSEISGSHFNPSFTVAVYACGGMELRMVLPYLLCQLSGGVLGAGLAKVVTSSENYVRAQGAALAVLTPDAPFGRALLVEAVLSCFITLVVLLGVVNARSRSPLVPVTVGGALLVSALAGGGVSGCCLNPARALGPAVLSSYWSRHWIYWVGPLSGALAAAALVRCLLGDENTRLFMKSS